jgi:hypothetical protein
MEGEPGPAAPSARTLKFRQAAFFYLHMGILYEAAVFDMARRGMLDARGGTPWIWLLAGAAIVAAVFWGLWKKQNIWVARIIWGLGLLRLPSLVGGAFFPAPETRIPPGFFLVALVIVLVNLWLLARAGWDL